MQVQCFIEGNIYLANVKRVEGRLKLFFNTNSPHHNLVGFNLPSYCCDNMKHRWKSWRDLKQDLLNRKFTDAVIISQN